MGPTNTGRKNRRGGFPIVALGASAGGLPALEEFFANLPADTGMAFVVVTHLHPGTRSMLDELLGRRTAMPVTEIDKDTACQPNHVYTVPSGRNLAIVGGCLHPRASDQSRPDQHPIDRFFRSLANDQKDRAIAIVLSGTGSDGTLGIKEIKGALGMVMVQDEQSASYANMPQSAMATGLVDYVLRPGEMPAKLIAYVRRAYGPPPRTLPDAADQPALESLQQLFVLLRARTRHDFSQYKGSTINRRIERRMNVHHLDSLKRYVAFVKENPTELDLLFKELLIGVTSFFRDPEAFEALAAALGALLDEKPDDYTVRIWVPGCSTGEEAYSIAILLREYLDRTKRSLAAQIFATDLDAEAIDAARAGIYPPGIAGDVLPSRLRRFFVRGEESFRVTKEIREMVVFAKQNLIEDPPFTKIDLLSCRNLLIYLETALQRRLLPVFHYALRPDGLLFLGSSESIGVFDDLFETVDKQWRVFQRREIAAGTYTLHFPSGIRGTPPDWPKTSAAQRGNPPGAQDLILRALVPPTVIVRERGDIVHIHGATGLFLELAPEGQSVANIFHMARPELRPELALLVQEAATSNEDVWRRAVPFKPNGSELLVDLRGRRVTEPGAFRNTIIVSFEAARPREPKKGTKEKSSTGKSPRRRSGLGRDLKHAEKSRQNAVAELEIVNRELTTANEELQSTNEELHSANEELETSREDAQALNEELQTVNSELQTKLDELGRANDDMRNLLNSTDIATIFLDNDLKIRRYTEQAKRIMRLIPSDVGRPFADLVPKLRYRRFAEDAREVLRTLTFKEVEAQGEDQSWYFMRILPYRTADNVIDGLVMVFLDVTKIRTLRRNDERLIQALRRSPTTVFGQDRDLRYRWISAAAFGRGPEAIVGKTDAELFDPEAARHLTEIKRRVIEGERAGIRETATLIIEGEPHVFDLYLEATLDEAGTVIGVTGVTTDVTPVMPKPA